MHTIHSGNMIESDSLEIHVLVYSEIKWDEIAEFVKLDTGSHVKTKLVFIGVNDHPSNRKLLEKIQIDGRNQVEYHTGSLYAYNISVTLNHFLKRTQAKKILYIDLKTEKKNEWVAALLKVSANTRNSVFVASDPDVYRQRSVLTGPFLIKTDFFKVQRYVFDINKTDELESKNGFLYSNLNNIQKVRISALHTNNKPRKPLNKYPKPQWLTINTDEFVKACKQERTLIRIFGYILRSIFYRIETTFSIMSANEEKEKIWGI
jgi:hypothetical protein